MCGIVGIMTAQGGPQEELCHSLERMRDTIAHRGPDDAGTWTTTSAHGAVALGFRRLAIIDLSELGHQPMTSPSGRFTMVFNGEVYNFASLRRELEALGIRFRGHSDSEVMLGAFDAWGVETAVGRFVGMFAVAVWDAERHRLYLMRDRMGIKPLFVSARNGTVLFGSEMKALRAGPGYEQRVDRSALVAYLRFLYVPAPRCIDADVIKLPPGHLLEIEDPSLPLPASRPYWSLADVVDHALATPYAGSESDAIDALERLLRDAVGLRLQADVPLGALLSGGVDSSLVIALMQAQASGRVKTFTIGFDIAAHDESQHAAAVAQHLGTDHTALHLTGADALGVVPRLPQMFDEPLADPSQIPTYLVCELARRSVTVALTGDGGDELFGGYNRYTYGSRLIPRLLRIPALLRSVGAAALSATNPGDWDMALNMLERRGVRLPGQKAVKLGGLLREPTASAMYKSLVSAWNRPAEFVNDGIEELDGWDRTMTGAVPSSLLDRMMLTDQQSYLADDLLAKVDRCSMAVSLEARVPLLDHRVVEFSWTLPDAWKIRDGQGKWILRQVLYRHVPRELVDRPKVGFSVPIDDWLRGPLRTWAEDLLATDQLKRAGTLDHVRVRREWSRFLDGQRTLGLGIWALVMYQAWEESLRSER
ncbi:MAG TPA: asparagine synthase (glutamine-hydrolyzing) [Gemmatimonadaceae bacterium]|nr:asparagine synthase (glutamine-hydrolyzing) [Gemmatimonadaceae bacterium]